MSELCQPTWWWFFAGALVGAVAMLYFEFGYVAITGWLR